MTLLLIFLVGVCLLGWHYSHERYRRLHRDFRTLAVQNERLTKDLARALDAISPPRERPPAPRPQFWPDKPYQRLAADLGIRLVDVEAEREAHSHAESAQRKDSA